ncbi:hypothetical protein ACN24L_17555 [Streptomyces microflavus]
MNERLPVPRRPLVCQSSMPTVRCCGRSTTCGSGSAPGAGGALTPATIHSAWSMPEQKRPHIPRSR